MLKKERINIYEVIKKFHDDEGWSIEWMCGFFEISRAAYYKWINKPINKRELENKEVLDTIYTIHEELNGLYGSYRMTIEVNNRLKANYNVKRIARLMCINEIYSVMRNKKRKWKRSTPEVTAENKLAREFEATRPNEKWCTDVTEYKIPGTAKKVYISTIIDLYDRYPIGYSLSLRNDTSLFQKSYEMALENHYGESTLFHSDRGALYTRKVVGQQLKEDNFIQSMSRVGCCIDNGPMEGFQGIIKDEIAILYDINSVESFFEIFDEYMYFYIHKRPQKRYKGQTPHQVRTNALQANKPEQYPIPTNLKIERYWDEIKSKQSKSLITNV
ncbi:MULTISPECIES: IS3 family transposase [unclassified Breznakia]|uniref:IS3 family transposase n=1 Tax=unclassified Breznakia TaxID=2623764 RepID=UPI0024763DC0|nr:MULTISPECIES: IS3 family transposase [unclassified Breznakia]